MSAVSMSSETANKPWLENSAWAARELRVGRPLGGCVLSLVYGILGGIAILCLLSPLLNNEPLKASISSIFMGIFLIGIIAAITYIALRHARYGDSVCRVITLPGVIGGWFKADVECGLSRDTNEPIIIRLNRGALPPPHDDSTRSDACHMHHYIRNYTAIPVAAVVGDAVAVMKRTA